MDRVVPASRNIQVSTCRVSRFYCIFPFPLHVGGLSRRDDIFACRCQFIIIPVGRDECLGLPGQLALCKETLRPILACIGRTSKSGMLTEFIEHTFGADTDRSLDMGLWPRTPGGRS